MLITRGLGTGLLITAGYGGLSVPVYPYYPTDSQYLNTPVLVQVMPAPFASAPSMIITAQPEYSELLSPYSVAEGMLTEAVSPYVESVKPNVQSAEVISNTPTPHTELPKRSE